MAGGRCTAAPAVIRIVPFKCVGVRVGLALENYYYDSTLPTSTYTPAMERRDLPGFLILEDTPVVVQSPADTDQLLSFSPE